MIRRDKRAFARVNVKGNGKNNTILVSDTARLRECVIYICGDNNTITIGEGCSLYKAMFWIEDSNNEICIGKHTTTSGACEFAAIE